MAVADRGFATFAKRFPERMKEIASKGGRAAHAKGTAHQWTAEEAQAAGRKGGSATKRKREMREHVAHMTGDVERQA